MYGCESWTIKKAECWRIDAFELLAKTLDSPLDCKEIQPLHPKGNQSWIFIGWTNTEAGTAILWPPDAKNWLIWKDPDAGKDWRQEGGAGDDRRCVGWMASLTLRTWVWVDSWSWWWTKKPDFIPGGHCCCCSVTQLCPILCDPMPGFLVFRYPPEFAQTHVH